MRRGDSVGKREKRSESGRTEVGGMREGADSMIETIPEMIDVMSAETDQIRVEITETEETDTEIGESEIEMIGEGIAETTGIEDLLEKIEIMKRRISKRKRSKCGPEYHSKLIFFIALKLNKMRLIVILIMKCYC